MPDYCIVVLHIIKTLKPQNLKEQKIDLKRWRKDDYFN